MARIVQPYCGGTLDGCRHCRQVVEVLITLVNPKNMSSIKGPPSVEQWVCPNCYGVNPGHLCPEEGETGLPAPPVTLQWNMTALLTPKAVNEMFALCLSGGTVNTFVTFTREDVYTPDQESIRIPYSRLSRPKVSYYECANCGERHPVIAAAGEVPVEWVR